MSAYITPDELQAQRDAGQAPTVIDVRGADEYAAGRVPGALNIPLDDLPAHLATIPHDRPVVTY